MYGMAVMTLVVAPAAPVPAVRPPSKDAGTVDRFQAQNFARMVHTLAQQVREMYVRPLSERDLIEGAVRGLYDGAGLTVPDAVTAAVRRAETSGDLVEALCEARVRLGNHPALAGSRSLFAAMNGFKHATDPISGLASPRLNNYASIDQDFGIGIELDGVAGPRWAVFQVEYNTATGRSSPIGYFGPLPKPEAIPCPAELPWRVKRVVPGSPAQKAGLKPGDVITHLDGKEVTAETANALFGAFAFPLHSIDPRTGLPAVLDRTLTLRRGDGKPFSVTLKTGGYTPESVFGVVRLPEDKWDCMLDRKAKIGYLRLGPIEMGLERRVAELMADLEKQGCRGLILDLRWCPGGYVDPGKAIAGMFLKDGSVIARMEYRNHTRTGPSGDVLAPAGGGKYADLPLAVLVGHETTGGGELIACALRDNDPGGKRCVVIGQRSVGRASIQSTVEAGFGGVQFRLTTGTSLRPNGKPRQKLPTSQPTDDWGVRPDEGLEVPVTADKSAELRRQAESHSLRPAESHEALPFDDPATDPYRLAALTYLRKKLGPAN